MHTAPSFPHSRFGQGLLGLALVVAFVGLSGCDRSAEPPASDSKVAPPSAASDKAAGEDGGCKGYAEALCQEFGAASDNCKAAKAVLDYIPAKACEAGLADLDYTRKQMEGAKASCGELVAKVCADLEKGSASCDMIRAQQDKIPPEQCKAMLGEYDSLLVELKRRDDQNKPLDAAAAAEIAGGEAASKGPEDAKVTIVEFSDFQCPYCSRAASASSEIFEKYGDKVRVVFRHFPLTFHKEAHLVSQAALAANAEGKFWEFHDLVFENQSALQREDLEKYAAKIGLNMSKFKEALDAGTYKTQVDNDLALGAKVNVSGTPTMFLNGKRVANSTAFAALAKDIDSALAN